MGWGTEFRTNIYLSRYIFRTEGEIEEVITSKKESLQKSKELVLMYAIGNWSEIKDKEDDILTLQSIIDDLVQDISTTSTDIYKLELYLDEVKEGKAKLTTNEETQD